jgi:hypothetical protein
VVAPLVLSPRATIFIIGKPADKLFLFSSIVAAAAAAAVIGFHPSFPISARNRTTGKLTIKILFFIFFFFLVLSRNQSLARASAPCSFRAHTQS